MTNKEKNLRPSKSGGAQPKKKSRTRQEQLRLKISIVCIVLIAVLLVFLTLNRLLFVKPELPDQQNPTTPTAPVSSDAPTAPPEEKYEDGIRPKSGGERKSEDFFTVLVLGRDTGGGGNTDTILLASYDVTNQKASVMSIPRDTMVNVPWDVKKLNSVYNWYGGGDRGIEKVYQEIAQLVGFEPDFRIIVEWDAVGEIVDAIGGVYFDVPYHMDYDDPDQDLHIHQEKGYRLLSGEDAMQVIRWRMNNKNSPYGATSIGDSGRMELQQNFLKSVMSQLLSIKNIGNIDKIADVFKNNVTTDLSFQNILWFGRQAVVGGLSVSDVNFTTMPFRGAYVWSRTYHTELAYVVPVRDKLLGLVNEHLSPFKEEFSLSDLDIMSVNEDGSVSSSSGQVQDIEATYPLSHWKPEEPEEPDPDPDEDPTEPPADDPSDLPAEPSEETPADTPAGDLPDTPVPSADIPLTPTPSGDTGDTQTNA